MAFNAWMHELRNLAARRELTWILGAAADNKAAFNDGLSPDEALNALIADAKE
jgi:hypothetical protein